MRIKYETNLLDEKLAVKAKAAADAQTTQTLPYSSARTRQFAGAAVSEEQTRRFGEPDVIAYSSPYTGQYVPANYAGAIADLNKSSSRKVTKIGLPENIFTAVLCIPLDIGLVTGRMIILT